MIRIIKNKKGITEIVGVAILLGMAIALFTIVQLMAITFPFNNPAPSARITASVDLLTAGADDDTIIILHQGGESISLDTRIVFVYHDLSLSDPDVIEEEIVRNMNMENSNGNSYWNIAEKLTHNPTDPATGDHISLAGKEVTITVVDGVSNSVIMQGTIQGG